MYAACAHIYILADADFYFFGTEGEENDLFWRAAVARTGLLNTGIFSPFCYLIIIL